MGSPIKYYIYVSDAKVDMLYSQIPQSLRKKIAAELRIDLNFGVANVGATMKQNQTEETRYSKLKLVVEYVEKHLNVGWIDAPSTYFKGSLPLKWGLYPHNEPPKLVYFGGGTDRTEFGMVGSPHHIIGNVGGATRPTVDFGYIPDTMLDAIAKIAELPSEAGHPLATEVLSPAPTLDVVYFANHYMNNNIKVPSQQLEFLAKTLLYDPLYETAIPIFYGNKKGTLLGSPIYVALAD